MDQKIFKEGALGLLAMGYKGVKAYRTQQMPDLALPNRAKKKRLLVIGWDAAEWQVINPLLDSGKLPALERLINEGVVGNIATLDPPLSPILWTSIGTGKRPYKHGVLGFTESIGEGKLGPISTKSRKVKTIWNMLNEKGLKTHTVGWWPSHPAEDINGIQVSNFYGKVSYNTKKGAWPMSRGTLSPKKLAPQLGPLRFHPEEIRPSHILPFVPNAHLVDQEKDNRLQHIVKYLCETISMQTAATWIMEQEDWDFMAVYFDAIDHFSHAFMKFYPPQLKGIPDQVYELYKEVINGIYIFHDMMLEHMLRYTDEETTVILLSDHGFYADHRRYVQLPKEPAAIAREHNPLGVLVMKGPGVKKDERIYGASLLDIAPTILHLFDQPVGEDFDGKVLSQAFKQANLNIKSIPTWEDEREGNTTVPDEIEMDEEALQQLVDLGYIDADTTETPEKVQKQLDEQNFYLARAYIDGSKFQEAAKILWHLCKKYPENLRYQQMLADCYANAFDLDSLGELNDWLKTLDPVPKKLIQHIGITQKMMSNQYSKALPDLLAYKSEYGAKYSTMKRIAKCYMNTNEHIKAIEYFEALLKQDDGDSDTLYSLGLTYMKKKEFEKAATYFLDTINIRYYHPLAHYCLGDCLYELGHYENAANAWEMCLKLFPKFIKVRNKLKELYCNEYPNEERLEQLSRTKIIKQKPLIYIVSGLPRSGTSMMMQMLKAAGLEILADKERPADENNQQGYFEFAPVKNLHHNAKFLKHANNKVVKIILPLLKFLPNNYHYKIIMMRRDINEILDSQHIMLQQLGKLSPNTSSFKVEHDFKNSLNEMEDLYQNENIEMIEVNYTDLINKKDTTYESIVKFLHEFDIDRSKLESVMNPDLYRSKKNANT